MARTQVAALRHSGSCPDFPLANPVANDHSGPQRTWRNVVLATRPPTPAASILRQSIGYPGVPSTTKLRNFPSLSRSGRRSLKAVELR